ncbi:uncharacterized protein VTP21DRAFT_4221 [Calcarisporiella thermophila]|uniref:uncharacterized protein n=1 Tax=Calcarisporiella thermophila TaxID=911321 RepID=UPI0037437400
MSADHKQDLEFSNALHGKAEQKNFISITGSKNQELHKEAVSSYADFWDGKDPTKETEEERAGRLSQYKKLTNTYYNIATDFYEYGWGHSFHFCRYHVGEGFQQALARHEHWLALQLELKPGMKVLDVGCGVGGPAREIGHFTGAYIVGLNNNDYQIERCRMYAKKEGLENNSEFVKGDFMNMPFEDNTFDAVYAIEATVHAPSLAGVYSEIKRVLKPGGKFACYEWVMTDKYDPNNEEHQRIKRGIELGDGIAQMCTTKDAVDALKESGYEVVKCEDLADPNDPIPWYYPMAGEWRKIQKLPDIINVLPSTALGRLFTQNILRVLEAVRLAAPGSVKIGSMLETAADTLAAGGKLGIFTPMFFFLAKKPE